MSFAFCDVDQDLCPCADAFLPTDPSTHRILLLPAREAGNAAGDDLSALRSYKRLCDCLLPALRARSHLFNLIHRHRHNCTVALCCGDTLLGGATFRLIRDSSGTRPSLILEVLLLAVAQRTGVCGRGHGSRIVNFLKALLRAHNHRPAISGAVAQLW